MSGKWKKELLGRFLNGLEVWKDEDFLPEAASKDHRSIFQSVYKKYFTQICESDVYKYKFRYIETVNLVEAEHREFFMNVKVDNITLRTLWESFRIHAYRGTDEKNVVLRCQRKIAGIIGLEMGSIWGGYLGSEVTVVEFAADIVPIMDANSRAKEIDAAGIDKVIAEKERDKILGVHMISPNDSTS
ncbi:hypothetical protein FXO37_28725 [Capsicum annuum]|nr:hypothetical protein FXO37_28725 [Capsicum annuum]